MWWLQVMDRKRCLVFRPQRGNALMVAVDRPGVCGADNFWTTFSRSFPSLGVSSVGLLSHSGSCRGNELLHPAFSTTIIPLPPMCMGAGGKGWGRGKGKDLGERMGAQAIFPLFSLFKLCSSSMFNPRQPSPGQSCRELLVVWYIWLRLCLLPGADLKFGVYFPSHRPSAGLPTWLWGCGWAHCCCAIPSVLAWSCKIPVTMCCHCEARWGVLVKERLCTDLRRITHSASFARSGLVSGRD